MGKIKNIRSSYRKYASTTSNPIGEQEYVDINCKYNRFLISKVLAGAEVTLPAKLGTLTILGRKSKLRFDDSGVVQGLAPDWVKTKKLWEENPEAKKERRRVFHLNSHTDGYRYKWVWSKNRVLVENKTVYALRMTRENKRAVSKLIKEGVPFKNK